MTRDRRASPALAVLNPVRVCTRRPRVSSGPRALLGAWFLATFVFSIPAFWFYDPVLSHGNYVVGSGQDTRIAVGAVLEIFLAISGIATAVVIFPIVKRVNERASPSATLPRARWSRSSSWSASSA
jgi:hypothetical protein